MAREKMTQCEDILKYIEENGSITQKDAYREFGCMRLAAQIYILKKRGYPIRRTIETTRNRYERTVSYARYYLCG